MHGPGRAALLPTPVITPFWIVTSDTTEFFASIVAIRPLISRMSRVPAQPAAGVCAAAALAMNVATANTRGFMSVLCVIV